MPVKKLQPLTSEAFKAVRFIATDMDGTLTQYEKFTPLLLQTLIDLLGAKIPVLVVTGRSAGWVSGLVHYLPVVGAIAENGGLFFKGSAWSSRGDAGELLVAISDVAQHRQELAQMFARLQTKFPQICESSDNQFRITDWTFDIQGLSLDEVQRIRQYCDAEGWGFTYSTVQCHIKSPQQEKAIGLQTVLSRYFAELTSNQIVTVGDSPNDESLFDDQQFPISVGVANIQDYIGQMIHLPAYITDDREAEGFWQLTQAILSSTCER